MQQLTAQWREQQAEAVRWTRLLRPSGFWHAKNYELRIVVQRNEGLYVASEVFCFIFFLTVLIKSRKSKI